MTSSTDGSPPVVRPKEIVVLAQTPPPYHGQAIMLKAFLDGTYKRIRLHHVRMAFSSSVEQVGKPGFKKIFHLFEVIFRVYQLRFKSNAHTLFFPPAGPNLAPVLRDIVILLATRWLFSECILNFRAAGLGEYIKTLSWPLRVLACIAYGRCDLAIVLASLTRSDAEALRAKKIVVVPSGVEDMTSKFGSAKSNQHTLTILFMGMVCKEKGVAVLLEACSQLTCRNFPYRCVIAGAAQSSEEYDAFKRIAAGISPNIIFKGLVTGDQKWRLYEDADIFCFPSFYSSEALPAVLLEAMMFGIPSVATVWRGIPEVVVQNETGVLVPPRDPNQLAEKLTTLLMDQDLRKNMVRAARELYETRYTIDAFRSRMEAAILANLIPTR